MWASEAYGGVLAIYYVNPCKIALVQVDGILFLF